jgi:hypothetical protein
MGCLTEAFETGGEALSHIKTFLDNLLEDEKEGSTERGKERVTVSIVCFVPWLDALIDAISYYTHAGNMHMHAQPLHAEKASSGRSPSTAKAQRHRTAIAGQHEAFGHEARHPRLDPLDRRLDVPDGTAAATLLAEDMPRLQRVP